jgi:acyl-CoA reductase-like NAD-dependent aldehyde dehydrogenase
MESALWQRDAFGQAFTGARLSRAATDSGLHEGVFSMVRGAGNEIGEALVDHPLIKAVTFTGFERGGMALYRRPRWPGTSPRRWSAWPPPPGVCRAR